MKNENKTDSYNLAAGVVGHEFFGPVGWALGSKNGRDSVAIGILASMFLFPCFIVGNYLANQCKKAYSYLDDLYSKNTITTTMTEKNMEGCLVQLNNPKKNVISLATPSGHYNGVSCVKRESVDGKGNTQRKYDFDTVPISGYQESYSDPSSTPSSGDHISISMGETVSPTGVVSVDAPTIYIQAGGNTRGGVVGSNGAHDRNYSSLEHATRHTATLVFGGRAFDVSPKP
jgi:hypothetical protein